MLLPETLEDFSTLGVPLVGEITKSEIMKARLNWGQPDADYGIFDIG